MHIFTLVQDYYNNGIDVTNFDTLYRAELSVKAVVWNRWNEYMEGKRPHSIKKVTMEQVNEWHDRSSEGDHPNSYYIQDQELRHTEWFPITFLHRDDVAAQLKRPRLIKTLTNEEMQKIAEDMRDDYVNQLYWESLDIIARAVLKDSRGKK